MSYRVALLLLTASATAAAQTYEVRRLPAVKAGGYGEVRLSKAALPGEQVRIWWATLLNPDCSAAGTMQTRIVEPPRHGQATLSDEPFFPSFVEPNPRAVCDAHKAPGKQAFYTADPAFHGHDKVVLENATSEGRIRRVAVDIDVR